MNRQYVLLHVLYLYAQVLSQNLNAIQRYEFFSSDLLNVISCIDMTAPIVKTIKSRDKKLMILCLILVCFEKVFLFAL